MTTTHQKLQNVANTNATSRLAMPGSHNIEGEQCEAWQQPKPYLAAHNPLPALLAGDGA
jgi:hypothetical protein